MGGRMIYFSDFLYIFKILLEVLAIWLQLPNSSRKLSISSIFKLTSFAKPLPPHFIKDSRERDMQLWSVLSDRNFSLTEFSYLFDTIWLNPRWQLHVFPSQIMIFVSSKLTIMSNMYFVFINDPLHVFRPCILILLRNN